MRVAIGLELIKLDLVFLVYFGIVIVISFRLLSRFISFSWRSYVFDVSIAFNSGTLGDGASSIVGTLGESCLIYSNSVGISSAFWLGASQFFLCLENRCLRFAIASIWLYLSGTGKDASSLFRLVMELITFSSGVIYGVEMESWRNSAVSLTREDLVLDVNTVKLRWWYNAVPVQCPSMVSAPQEALFLTGSWISTLHPTGPIRVAL